MPLPTGPGLVYQQLDPSQQQQQPMGQNADWLQNIFAPQNQNALMGLASSLLSQSGWQSTPTTFGQAVGNSLPAFAAGQAQDQENSFLTQQGLGGVPAGLASKILEARLRPHEPKVVGKYLVDDSGKVIYDGSGGENFHTLTTDEARAAGLPTDRKWQVGPNGKIDAVYTPPQSAGVDQPSTEEIETIAQGIASGQLPPITGYAAKQPRAAKIMARVLTLNPDYRGTDYGSHAAGEKYFTSGLGGRQTKSMVVAHSHLDTLGNLVDALDNGDVQVLNGAKQSYREQTGNPAPTNFDAAKRIVADEVVKAIVGGNSALGDREEAAKSISRVQSPQQLREVIRTYQELMRGQLDGLRSQYQQSTARDDFDQRFLGGVAKPAAKPASDITPEQARAELKRRGKM